MAAPKKQFPLDALRTDGWFERIGEGIGSFQALCEIVGERFFAFSIIVGARITALTIDRRVTKDWYVFPWEAVAPAEAIAEDAAEVPERIA